jgi:hypothetical protein
MTECGALGSNAGVRFRQQTITVVSHQFSGTEPV